MNLNRDDNKFLLLASAIMLLTALLVIAVLVK
jgi:hypothetical protein